MQADPNVLPHRRPAWIVRRSLSWVAMLAGAVVLLPGWPFNAFASAHAKPRLVVSWPGTSFVGYRLEIRGRVTGWPQPVGVALQRKDGRAWRAFGRAISDSSGAFVVSSPHAGRVGGIRLRLVVRAGSRLLARRFATVRIRPLPIVIPADRMQYLPQEGDDNKPLLFSLAGASGCPRAAVGPTVYKNNFVAVGYNAQTAPHGFLGKIKSIQCRGQTGRIYTYPASLGDAVQDGFLDLARFTQKAGPSPATSAQKSMSATFDLTGCSPAAPSQVTASADISVTPRLTMRFSSRLTPDDWVPPNLASLAFTATGSTSLSLAVHANAPAGCDLVSLPLINQYHDSPIATYQGWVGPIPVVVDLVGYAGIRATLAAPARTSQEFHAYDTFDGTAAYPAPPGSSGGSDSGFRVTATQPTVTGNADILANLQAGFEIGLYGGASYAFPSAGLAHFDTELDTNLHADTTAAAGPWWTINAGGKASAALESFNGGATPEPAGGVDFGSSTFALAADGPFPGPTGTVTFPNPGDQTGVVGTPVNLQLHATASDGGPVVFRSLLGGLPEGLHLDGATGLITGTPTLSFDFFWPMITATGATGPSATIRFKWPISPASRTATTSRRAASSR